MAKFVQVTPFWNQWYWWIWLNVPCHFILQYIFP